MARHMVEVDPLRSVRNALAIGMRGETVNFGGLDATLCTHMMINVHGQMHAYSLDDPLNTTKKTRLKDQQDGDVSDYVKWVTDHYDADWRVSNIVPVLTLWFACDGLNGYENDIFVVIASTSYDSPRLTYCLPQSFKFGQTPIQLKPGNLSDCKPMEMSRDVFDTTLNIKLSMSAQDIIDGIPNVLKHQFLVSAFDKACSSSSLEAGLIRPYLHLETNTFQDETYFLKIKDKTYTIKDIVDDKKRFSLDVRKKVRIESASNFVSRFHNMDYDSQSVSRVNRTRGKSIYYPLMIDCLTTMSGTTRKKMVNSDDHGHKKYSLKEIVARRLATSRFSSLQPNVSNEPKEDETVKLLTWQGE